MSQNKNSRSNTRNYYFGFKQKNGGGPSETLNYKDKIDKVDDIDIYQNKNISEKEYYGDMIDNLDAIIAYDDSEKLSPPTPRHNAVYEIKDNLDAMIAYDPESDIKPPYKKQPPQVRMIIGNLVNDSEVESMGWRRKLANAISSGDLKIDQCNLTQWLTDFKVLGKSSASNTSVVLASTHNYHLNRGVSIKIAYKGGEDNSLDIERGFYKIFFDFIQQQFFSPNVVTFYASFSCSTKEFRKIMTKENKLKDLYKEDQLLNKLIWDDTHKDDRETLNFLVIERTQGNALAKMLPQLTGNELKSVLFQIIYTFEVFNRLGLRHNDAHLGNIFIDILDGGSPVGDAIYATEVGVFKIDVTKMVKFFDLDLASTQLNCDKKGTPKINNAYIDIINELKHYDLCKNTKLDGEMCDEYGMCNNDLNEYFDSFLTLGNIMKQLINLVGPKPKDTSQRYAALKFLQSHVGSDLFKTKFSFPFHLGKEFYQDTRDQNRSYKPHSKNFEMSSPYEMLKDPYFNELKLNTIEFRKNCQHIPVYQLPKLYGDCSPNEIIPDSCFKK